jgi:hypothetical protein
LLNSYWPGKAYEPILAFNKLDNESKLYLKMYDEHRVKENASLYLRPPSEWPLEKSPYFGEPPPNGELGLVSKSLYGLETLQRVGFAAHPCSEPSTLLYVAIDWRNGLTPVFHLDRANPLKMDLVVIELIRPWFSKGQGLLVCPICLIETGASNVASLKKFARGHYIAHWEAEHSQALMALTVFSGTQLHSRVHQGQMAYVLALANHSDDAVQNPKGQAIDPSSLRKHIRDWENTLKVFLGPDSRDEEDSILFSDGEMDSSPVASATGVDSSASSEIANLIPETRGVEALSEVIASIPQGRYLSKKKK